MERHVEHNLNENQNQKKALARHALNAFSPGDSNTDSSCLTTNPEDIKQMTLVHDGHKAAAPIDVFVNISANQDRYLQRALLKVEEYQAHLREAGQMDLTRFLLYVQNSAEVDERTANIIFDYMKETKKLSYRISRGVSPAGN